jgi:hypothetical protein
MEEVALEFEVEHAGSGWSVEEGAGLEGAGFRF